MGTWPLLQSLSSQQQVQHHRKKMKRGDVPRCPCVYLGSFVRWQNKAAEWCPALRLPCRPVILIQSLSLWLSWEARGEGWWNALCPSGKWSQSKNITFSSPSLHPVLAAEGLKHSASSVVQTWDYVGIGNLGDRRMHISTPSLC